MMPMIDVVFLLLIYFLWTTSFDPPPTDLPGAIAAAPDDAALDNGADTAESPARPLDEIIIHLRSTDGQITATLNDKPIDAPETLRRRIAEIIALGVNPPIIVDPEGSIPLGIVVSYYDAARSGGGDRVLFAVSDP